MAAACSSDGEPVREPAPLSDEGSAGVSGEESPTAVVPGESDPPIEADVDPASTPTAEANPEPPREPDAPEVSPEADTDPIEASASPFEVVPGISVRFFPTATALDNGSVLVVGGFGVRALLAESALFDPNDGSVREAASLLIPRQTHEATLLADGRVLITGGVIAGGGAFTQSSTEIYDPVSDTFVTGASMRDARLSHAAVRLADGRVVVAGGAGIGTPFLRSVEVYDPVLDRFNVVGELPEGTGGSGMNAVRLDDGRVLILGGGRAAIFDADSSSNVIVDASSRLTVEGFDEVDFRWPSVPTRLAGGTILITGDCCDEVNAGEELPAVATPIAAIYDPQRHTLSAIASMTIGRSLHTATLLCDGRVLITGGVVRIDHSVATSTAAAEIFDPSTGTFSAIHPLPNEWSGHTSTLLPDGSVLAIGDGSLRSDAPLAVRYVPPGSCAE